MSGKQFAKPRFGGVFFAREKSGACLWGIHYVFEQGAQ